MRRECLRAIVLVTRYNIPRTRIDSPATRGTISTEGLHCGDAEGLTGKRFRVQKCNRTVVVTQTVFYYIHLALCVYREGVLQNNLSGFFQPVCEACVRHWARDPTRTRSHERHPKGTAKSATRTTYESYQFERGE